MTNTPANLPRERWLISEALHYLLMGDAAGDWQPVHQKDYQREDIKVKELLGWLRQGRLRAYGRRYLASEGDSLDLDREFEAIEPHRWLPGNASLWQSQLSLHNRQYYADIFVGKRDIFQLVGQTETNSDDTDPASRRGRRVQHDREYFWRLVAATQGCNTELKQAAFIAEIQQAFIDLQEVGQEPPGETYLKERFSELRETIARLNSAKRSTRSGSN